MGINKQWEMADNWEWQAMGNDIQFPVPQIEYPPGGQ